MTLRCRAVLLAVGATVLVAAASACGSPKLSHREGRDDQMIEANRKLVNPCAIPTPRELRNLGMSSKPHAHTITFLNNVCSWGDDAVSVSIEVVRALSNDEHYFGTHDDGPAMVGGAERAVMAEEYVGPAAAGTWGRSIIARNDRAIVTVAINHRPEGIDPVPILSVWATRTLAAVR